MATSLKISMVGRLDTTAEKAEYYFTVPHLPCLVDLSKVVIFVHPFENSDGTFGAEMVIKEHDKNYAKRKNNSNGSDV